MDDFYFSAAKLVYNSLILAFNYSIWVSNCLIWPSSNSLLLFSSIKNLSSYCFFFLSYSSCFATDCFKSFSYFSILSFCCLSSAIFSSSLTFNCYKLLALCVYFYFCKFSYLHWFCDAYRFLIFSVKSTSKADFSANNCNFCVYNCFANSV